MVKEIPTRWLVLASYILPSLVLALLILLSIAPVQAMGYNDILPPFIYVAVYYWSIFRPSAMPAVLAFSLGIVMDLLTGATLGLHAFILLILRWLLKSQRRFLMGQPFIALWLVFFIVTMMGRFMYWGLFSLFERQFIPIQPALIGALFCIAVFPLFYGLMHNVHRLLDVASEKSV